MAGHDERGEIDHGRAAALRAVRAQLVVVSVESREAAQVDHGANLPREWLRG